MKDFTLGTMYWINPLASQEEILRDFADMRENGFSLIRIIAWWELIEEKESCYTFSHIDRVFQAAEKTGCRLMPTIGFYPPVWLIKKLALEGKDDPGRYPMVMRPEIQEPLSKLIQLLVTRFRRSPALAMWNIWNEPTVNATINSIRLRRFADWLRKRYTTAASLQAAWRGEYPVFSLMCPDSPEELTAEWLSDAFRYGTRGRNCVIRYDWFHFLTDELNAEAQWLSGEVKRHDPVHPVHANLHSLSANPLNDGRDLFALASVLDTVSCSIHTSNDYPGGKELYAPLWNYAFGAVQCRSWSKGAKHTMIGELQAGTTNSHWRRYTPQAHEIRYELCKALAEGLDGIVFWLWRGWKAGTFELGEFSLRNPADGGPTERSAEIRKFSELCRKHHDILKNLRRPDAPVAIFCSQEEFVYRKVLSQDRPFNNLQDEPSHALFGCFKALQEANYGVDFITEKEILRGDLNRYRILYMPMCEVIGKETATAIREFAAAGGNLYADGRTGWLDEHMYLRGENPVNGMAQVFGAAEEDYIMGESDAEISAGAARIHGTPMRRKLRPMPDAEISAIFEDGSAAAVDHTFGKGKTRLAGCGFSLRLYDRKDPETSAWIASFAKSCGILPEFDLPYGIAGTRLSGTEYELLVFHNHGKTAESFQIPVRGSLNAVFYHSAAEVSGSVLACSLKPGETEAVIIKNEK